MRVTHRAEAGLSWSNCQSVLRCPLSNPQWSLVACGGFSRLCRTLPFAMPVGIGSIGWLLALAPDVFIPRYLIPERISDHVFAVRSATKI